MKAEFIRCEFCKAETPTETCQFAAYHTVVDGKEYVFCCESCAQRTRKKQKKR